MESQIYLLSNLVRWWTSSHSVLQELEDSSYYKSWKTPVETFWHPYFIMGLLYVFLSLYANIFSGGQASLFTLLNKEEADKN